MAELAQDMAASIKPDFDQIPARLRAGKRHVVWNKELRRDGKIGKPPFIARAFLARGELYRASSTKSQSWSTFPQAQAAYEHGEFAGIGRVLCGDITLVDIDHCIRTVVTENGIEEEIHPAAQEIIDLLASYTERSPSGDGIHIFLVGAIPEGAPNRYTYKDIEVEVYSTERYSTLTGHRIPGTPADLNVDTATIPTFLAHLVIVEDENTVLGGGGGTPSAITNADPQSVTANGNEIVGATVCASGTTMTARLVAPQGERQRAGSLHNGTQVVRQPQRLRKNAESNVSPLSQRAGPVSEADLPPGDQLVLVKARQARNAHNFMALWEGDDPQHRGNKSNADFDLVLQLLYWTNDDQAQTERLYRASGRYDEKTERSATREGLTYLEHTIAKARLKRYGVKTTRPTRQSQQAIPRPAEVVTTEAQQPAAVVTQEQQATPRPAQPTPQRAPIHQDRRITHAHRWTRATETEEERQEKLQAAAFSVAQQIEQHVRNGQNDLLLVANVAPGVGKSSTVAPLGIPGTGLNLAWIAERRDMMLSVPALQYYNQIQPCTKANCEDHHLHNALGERGYNAWSVHKQHGMGCHYVQQFDSSTSAVYQLAHVRTRYPANHQGIIIDELDISKWLPEREITIGRLSASARVYSTESTADLLLRTVAAVITDASQAKHQLHGQALFEALDKRSAGKLAGWIGELAQNPHYTNTHPWPKLEEEDPAAQIMEASTLAPVVLPHIVVALVNEFPKWQRGQDWNSCLRIGPGTFGWALHITERLRFTKGEAGLPARAILDATADAEILTKLTGEQVRLSQAQIDPPPGTRHIAIRTGKRYGKMSLTTKRKDGKENRDLGRAIAEARYILREEDPDGQARAAHKVGLISFMGCVSELGEALGVPEHRRLHFWAARGSNALEDCDILLVIGTPTIHPATVARLARALYQDDEAPISDESEVDNQGVRRYTDERMERVNAYLTRTELTQCAHRSRALRAKRTVITFCLGEIDYLPATETVTDLPQLLPDGRERWTASREAETKKLEQAREMLEQQGRTLAMMSVRELKATAHVSTDAAAEYLRQERAEVEQKPHTHTHTPCSQSVPEDASKTVLATRGTESQEMPPPPTESRETAAPAVFLPRPGTATEPPEYRQPCKRCGHIDDWQRDPSGERWICSCYYWWHEHPERRGQQQLGVVC